MKCLSIVVSAALLLPTVGFCADQPTAEETVAFILYGIENGSYVDVGSTSLGTYKSGIVSQTSSAPAEYSFPAGMGEYSSISVKQTDPCVFSVISRDKAGQNESRSYDFNHFATLVFTSRGDGRIGFSGECPIVREDGNCGKNGTVKVDNIIFADRLEKAVDFLKQTYCPGAPF
ncbi:hypothetical protein JET14_12130 [Martelella lutilitoris]|uniref:Uncharacterized protein n=1 Tax=Martelella lutilitoris TaxID=2583532 RepID=A0A7T7HH43_9HYPH|nr:hypothetical protein [Martelella lutilitoris]QQM29085.1 hypothetical protein JET14_12130 [Martelella lutilitoris]